MAAPLPHEDAKAQLSSIMHAITSSKPTPSQLAPLIASFEVKPRFAEQIRDLEDLLIYLQERQALDFDHEPQVMGRTLTTMAELLSLPEVKETVEALFASMTPEVIESDARPVYYVPDRIVEEIKATMRRTLFCQPEEFLRNLGDDRIRLTEGEVNRIRLNSSRDSLLVDGLDEMARKNAESGNEVDLVRAIVDLLRSDTFGKPLMKVARRVELMITAQA